ncbi:GBS Bsp-like repeat-containing protein [Clostridium formicaceticum]|uniref:GBS Bsp-like repeat protein n=1 Tax=Clostridium formicaceticum TaxID=1497 RepID=A0AAC9WF75_9CLOT|nr:GBS Bsp-like repeat-containing protein [Clostridium formicaceticum]AOY76013.1 hypothetical protein BJL90_08945 [Clostridium formicaceticum]ARE86369.1 GBS Bsp-like repeat protein [Clostridium formicaceticum]
MYDDANRLIEVTYNEYKINYIYDDNGNMIRTTSADLDTEGPTADSITNSGSPTTGSAFKVYANNVVDAGSAIDKVVFPTWTVKNGQNDLIWHEGTYLGNGKWGVTINIGDHNNETGEYIVHIYGYDKAGNNRALGSTKVVVL